MSVQEPSRWEWPLVTHRWEPGYVSVILGDSGEVHRSRPDKTRCARCGRREDDKAHEDVTDA